MKFALENSHARNEYKTTPRDKGSLSLPVGPGRTVAARPAGGQAVSRRFAPDHGAMVMTAADPAYPIIEAR
jgi:hypothetical protein